MSRSGYNDDYDGEVPGEFWRQAVRRATTGYRGQYLLKRLRAALDAMPEKRLITDAIRDDTGNVCALGALDPHAPEYDGDGYLYAQKLAAYFGIAHSLAAEITYMNDEYMASRNETPEARWVRMRAWVDEQIVPDEPESVDAVDPAGDRDNEPSTREKRSSQ